MDKATLLWVRWSRRWSCKKGSNLPLGIRLFINNLIKLNKSTVWHKFLTDWNY